MKKGVGAWKMAGDCTILEEVLQSSPWDETISGVFTTPVEDGTWYILSKCLQITFIVNINDGFLLVRFRCKPFNCFPQQGPLEPESLAPKTLQGDFQAQCRPGE